MSDFDLVGGEVSPLDAGRPIAVGSMKGRSRAYSLTARNRPGKSALSVAFNDRCDMIVATAVVPHDHAVRSSPASWNFSTAGPCRTGPSWPSGYDLPMTQTGRLLTCVVPRVNKPNHRLMRAWSLAVFARKLALQALRQKRSPQW